MKDPIYLDGKWMPLSRARISPLNSAFLYGESLLEAIPVYQGRPLFFQDHVQRIQKGCVFLGWPKISRKELERAIRSFVAVPGASRDYLLRVGLVQEIDPPAQPRAFSTKPPRFLALARPLRHDLLQAKPSEGKVGISSWKVPAEDAFPGSFKWIFYMMIRREFRLHPQWDEMLRLNALGFVVDGGSSSPLWAHSGKIYAPPLGLGGLEGVTRKWVLRLSKKMGLKVVEKFWKPRDVFERGELFFVGSGVGVFRATHLQGRKLDRPTPVTLELWNCFREWALHHSAS